MAFIGYHASHEQLAPSALLEAVIAAERLGFDGAFSADHLSPWTPQQGHSGNTIAWLGAALASTRFSIGSVATPGQLYHPVVSAQAIATLAEMFPGRYFAALGSGELLNEHVTGALWPSKDERTARLGECVEVMRGLLAGETVNHDGRVRVHEARLWSLPAGPSTLMATAASAATARWAAGWADGLVTVGTRRDQVAEIADAYLDAGGLGPTCLQVHIALAATIDEATALVRDQWLHGVVTPPEAWDIAQPEEFAARAGEPSDAELAEHVIVATDSPSGIAELADRLADLMAAGFDRLYIHEIAQDQRAFLGERATKLLDALRERLDGAADERGGAR
ncbi:LLM class flavin-dependent oxidoreductase [Microbacterium sp. cf332]|uniref:LLM class flavin-dependent oxidoreductase n=1 Tax=Microbacterium sp. cf332 TaxID=1761804 RepID=UPI00088B639E|nr:LLM class flavin-dependent oxidoreductase [Microbacterium sp. cf332]SDQ97061.1 F420-dependent oxidoreductase, G6PDH family [Microbacterium sp. cf332]